MADAATLTAPRTHRRHDVEVWLRTNPSAQAVRDVFPDQWSAAQREIAEVLATGGLDQLVALTTRAPHTRSSARRRSHSMPQPQALLDEHIHSYRRAEALRQIRTSLVTGVRSGRVRFNLVSGWILQRLFFERDLVRKPVSIRAFKLFWPLVRQRRFLMPLVQPKGIYCFYSDALIARLAKIIGDQPCLEIAAGDGTLTRFLAASGVNITATDDHSWQQIDFTDDVRRQDARTALRVHQPSVVICSWPPAGNRFERDVFATASVDTYIVIGTKIEVSAGDWNAYRKQTCFEMTEDADLSSLVLPPDLHPAIYVFRRRCERKPTTAR
jgi:hypothetical protein